MTSITGTRRGSDVALSEQDETSSHHQQGYYYEHGKNQRLLFNPIDGPLLLFVTQNASQSLKSVVDKISGTRRWLLRLYRYHDPCVKQEFERFRKVSCGNFPRDTDTEIPPAAYVVQSNTLHRQSVAILMRQVIPHRRILVAGRVFH
mmetsp:Transcript_28980/g.47857  ORF Transcript_28980/g.47857 Transcript_28980/m.47857 type:complete len:147 (+) Transcript_28980:119-559(+)